MINQLLAKVIGTKNERELKKLWPMVAEINALEPETQRLTDGQLRAKTEEFKLEVAKAVEGLEGAERIAAEKAMLETLLPRAFAVVREAGRRTVNMRHFDVQLIGGMVLHQGKISEMKTGEGKTLVATLPVYLNSLLGKGVHVVTVNDYLAKRDAEWMGRIYKFLGLSVGVIVHDLDDEERRNAYASDVTYGTNNEFGFDYLRDNMKFRIEDCVQRPHHFAIVDEVDSILIDEARTPLIISGASEESTDKYYRVNRIIPKLERGEETKQGSDKIQTGDFIVDEKHKLAVLTEQGWGKVEGLLGIENISDMENFEMKHHVEVALKAHALFHRDRDYVVKPKDNNPRESEVVIVDEFTGRLMPGRRWSDGLHQAVEAKEGVKIERENQTLATITFQNYFRMYKKLAGMTGTAETEAAEFDKIYKLEVMVIPTNRTLVRVENPDVVYRTEPEKFKAVVNEIKDLNKKGQPVLVGTISIEKSETLAAHLKKAGVPHVVLNAKFHEREATIVAQAGRRGAVTVATNMAGRGTDILLGGNPEFMSKEHVLKNNLAQSLPKEQATFGFGDPEFVYFFHGDNFFRVPRPKWDEVFTKFKTQTDAEHDDVVSLGGLHILGTERHEARRIDNQLRGRAGRQGDPGSSRFYMSLEDDLLRIFAGERISSIMQRFGMEEDVPIESRLITRRIEAAQRAVEAQNFEARKHLLEYDDVMNKQREAVYGLRRQLLEGLDQRDYILNDVADGVIAAMLDTYCSTDVTPDEWDLAALNTDMQGQFGVDIIAAGLEGRHLNREELRSELQTLVHQKYEEKEALVGPENLRFHERMIMLQVVDSQWKDHLLSMDHLKEGIGLRGYGQKDPLIEYKKESFTLFQEMMDRIESETLRYLWLMRVVSPEEEERMRVEVDTAAAEAREQRARTRGSQMDDFVRDIERKKQRELDQMQLSGSGEQVGVQTIHRGEKIGRNDPCPCGSGKKYKKCCGVSA